MHETETKNNTGYRFGRHYNEVDPFWCISTFWDVIFMGSTQLGNISKFLSKVWRNFVFRSFCQNAPRDVPERPMSYSDSAGSISSLVLEVKITPILQIISETSVL